MILYTVKFFKIMIYCQIFTGSKGSSTTFGSHAIWLGSTQLYWTQVCTAGDEDCSH